MNLIFIYIEKRKFSCYNENTNSKDALKYFNLEEFQGKGGFMWERLGRK